MDRSRIIIALLLIATILSLFLGLANIVISSRDTSFVESTENFFSTGHSGIALIRVYGVIVDGEGGRDESGADRVIRQLRQARSDSSIRAVILAVNSPGGTVVATKKIYDAIHRFRESEKPVVAIVSDIAASGGYYVASAAEYILAYRGSIIGSIGVISFHINISGLLNRYGIHVTTIKSGRLKDSSYPFRDMTYEELAARRRIQGHAYMQFIRDVAEGRKEKIGIVQNRWAEGRIFSGEEARRENMIDNFGGREEAVEYIRKKLRTTAPLPIFEPQRDFLEQLFNSMAIMDMRHRVTDPLTQATDYYLYPGVPLVAEALAKRLAPQIRWMESHPAMP